MPLPPLMVACMGPLEHCDAGHGGLRRGAGRDDGTADRGVVVEIHAAQLFVDVVAEDEIGGDGEIAGDLALRAEAEVLGLGRDEILSRRDRWRS